MATSNERSWELQHFVDHGSHVNCLALDHKSGRLLVTGGDDMMVNVWDIRKHSRTKSLSGHSTPVVCVKYEDTKKRICSGSNSGILKIWDLEKAEIYRTLHGHRAAIRCLDFHSGGNLLASGSLDTLIKVWDINQKSLTFACKGHRIAVNSLKFSPDGQWIASGGDDCLVKLWDFRAHRLLKEFSGHTDCVTAVEFHPEEFLLASSSCDHVVNFWELKHFRLVSTIHQGVGSIRCLNFSQRGGCLFAGSRNLLKVYGWKSAKTYDTIPTGWKNLQDIVTTSNQLIGASSHLSNVALFAVDLNRVQQQSSLLQRIRNFFSLRRPLDVIEPELRIDMEDQPQLAGTENKETYEEVFKPRDLIPRTPPPVRVPAPLEDGV